MKKYSKLLVLGAVTCSVLVGAQEPRAASEIKAKSQVLTRGVLWSANASIGADVVSANGDDLGDVVDIVLDRNKNRIAYVIVSYGGLLGVGDKHFAVPWQAFGQTSDRELSLQIAPEQLKDAPGFDKGTLPDTANPLFHEGVYKFYNTKPYSLGQRDLDHAQAEDSETIFDWGSWVNRGDDTNWARRLGELIGTDIENASGESIAELEDVIVDTREARAAFAVISYGGTLGFFENTAIIPWNALRLDVAREVYVTDATPAQFEQAKLSDSEYQKLEDQKYSEALYGTFKTKTYWEEFGYESGTSEALLKADATSGGANDPNSVSGIVVSVSNYTGDTEQTKAMKGVRVRIRTESGLIRTVHLASTDELEREELTVLRGDEVVIMGRDQDYRGHMVFQATELRADGKTTILEQ